MYIAIEGIDTVGKTTQIDLLKANFKEAVITKEPGGSKLGKEIREMVLGENSFSARAEFLLFLADRAEHIDKVITPHLDKFIISDRSLVSGIAYANTKIAYRDLLSLNHFATDHTLPDKIFLITIDKETLAYRLSQKSHDNIESRGIDFLLHIQERLKQATLDLGIELIEIDGRGEIQDIHLQILGELHV